MVFQDYAVWPHMTVFDNVAYPLKIARVAAAELHSRTQTVIALVGLAGLEQRLPSQLSGGQQQRVAVARALAGDPLILLADEPTGNLDSANGEAVMTLLKELHKNGSTICMVTHDPRYASFADRSLHLFDGRIVEESVAAS
jgi:putative ABC transport system ATP-binding protein